ncbi:hypothetical protein BH10PSE17_BH10PSE17_23180 [soil metagenome]
MVHRGFEVRVVSRMDGLTRCLLSYYEIKAPNTQVTDRTLFEQLGSDTDDALETGLMAGLHTIDIRIDGPLDS